MITDEQLRAEFNDPKTGDLSPAAYEKLTHIARTLIDQLGVQGAMAVTLSISVEAVRKLVAEHLLDECPFVEEVYKECTALIGQSQRLVKAILHNQEARGTAH